MLDLEPAAEPFEVLERSGGRSATDTLELTPIPDPGPFEVHFLVHGIRHLDEEEQARIDTLEPGQSVTLTPEPDNEVDCLAVLVTDDGHRLGYVPRPLLEYVRPAMGHPHELTVERINSPAAGFHMRLLVRPGWPLARLGVGRHRQQAQTLSSESGALVSLHGRRRARARRALSPGRRARPFQLPQQGQRVQPPRA
ncbi:HIRAN domain-containing protein [Janibacter limosus]|uniref:HIRAN domain-containing protein n=1 Tax=Janibacter limosus TaxID=53458 RepID=A0AC61U1F4_9MICO|nr:HIRAN domain-containing protein [Janibacter limosus]UUZ43698.1 HIRAN domain-containing protein [Janibacter limosus]